MGWTENKWLKPAWMGENNDFTTKYQGEFSKIGGKFAPNMELKESNTTNVGYEKDPEKRGIFLCRCRCVDTY